ncbi:right-handed parallel beta-helix repeat-containing protein, partial [Yoonia sp.]|uniref:right-handed parallel beta-helix repeat-containing protein n=1 Tax=Yoonia sp. TaxID=2212373 RepID=UPI0019FB2CD2
MFRSLFQWSRKLQQQAESDTTEETVETTFFGTSDGDTTLTLSSGTTTSDTDLSGSGRNSPFWMFKDKGQSEPKAEKTKPEKTTAEPVPEPDPVVVAPAPAPEPEIITDDPIPVVKDVIAEDPAVKETPLEDVVAPGTPTTGQDVIAEEPVTTGNNTGGTPVVIDDTTATQDDVIPVAEEPAPVEEDPAVNDPVAQDPVVNDPAPVPDVAEPVSVTRQVAPTTLDSSGPMGVAGGRVTTFTLPDAATITGITINSLPAHGNVTVNPDFTLALVLSGSDYAGPLSFDYTVTHSDGTTVTHTATLDVAPPTQAAGWGLGNHYMLETDANDNLVVEHGDNHRKVYISGSEDALTRADIAALEGVDESVITTTWLRNNPEYGGSEGMALAADVGMQLWYGINPFNSVSSNWLLFERGYNYDTVNVGGVNGRLIQYGTSGESELAPIHITSWGQGDLPVINDKVSIFQEPNVNIVFTDISFVGGIRNLSGTNVILDSTEFTNGWINTQNVSGFTLINSKIMDGTPPEPLAGDYWTGTSAGMFVSNTSGILIEGNLIHHNGWEDDYLLDGSADGGAPPNMFSHNVYLQSDDRDVTFRDNIISQGSSFGAHIRGGGYIEGNVF